MATFPQRRMDHILVNGTEYERTLASQVDRLLDLNIPIRDLWNPWTCPENLLPYLAWTLSVDIWDPSWELTKRRSVVANAIKHHQIKGTLQAIETYLGLVDSQVLQTWTPPQKIFSGPSLTREQREAWLEKLPQIRVWRQYERSVKGNRVFSGGSRYNSFFEGKFLQPNNALSRLARRARWVVNEVETDSRVENFEGGFRVFIKAVRAHSTFSNTPFNLKGKFLIPSTSSQRVVTIAPIATSPWRMPVGPQLEPVTAEPELVSVAGKEGYAVYCNRPIHKRFFVPSMSGYRIYERYAVNDGSVIAGRRPSIQFMGVGRYGMAPKTAELKVRMRKKWPKAKARLGEASIPHTRFFIPHDGSLKDKNRKAVISAKRLTDKVLLNTTTVPGFIAGLPRFAGDSIVI
ncbi:phage tail protein I [Bradyrhizobium sp. SZCCHNR3118]|uniref:phage tail protein I n=1 Tax=Bradyrhizobium sp. SZCCHNR3118 TaxID=3057468 RepID=UPI002916DC53|nr:phage tail protein I [Bradyrhizobium sp. SZCCHNR3118]